MAGTNSWALSVAARDGEPWLAAALNHTSQPEDERISDRVLDWLEHIANYRTTHDITARNPLGPLPHNPEQRARWKELADQGHDLDQPEPIAATRFSHLESPNDHLLDQLDELDRTGNGNSSPDLGIER